MAESKKYTKAWVPPESSHPFPVQPRVQILPLNQLPWDSFQRLCTRLAERDHDVEYCQEYGTPGQKQEGIDIYIRKPSSSQYAVWQCKRYQPHTFQPSHIHHAVSDFLSGSWASKTDEFVLALSVKTEEASIAKVIETQASHLRERNIRFLPLGITQISKLLKAHPDLVDDFFGREWVPAFCGAEADAKLSGRRLQSADVIRLRQLLRRCYTQHFDLTDPGIPSLAGSVNPDVRPPRLVDRFVPPDVLEERLLPRTEMVSDASIDQSKQHPGAEGVEYQTPSSPHTSRVVTHHTVVRHSAVEWLSTSHLSVVLGDPGIGKSTLLRCLLLDLLSAEPRYDSCARRWGHYLPVWVPFAMWTRLVGESETKCSLPDVLTTWFRKVSADEGLITLVREALGDSRLLLFVDGLDEWSDETTARTTLTLLEQFVGERRIPAIASSRPLGYARIGGLSTRWHKVQLAGLTKEQQSTLAEHWFLHRLDAFATHDNNRDSLEMRQTRAQAAAAEHIQNLHHDVRLARLAEVPLLLNGLIALAIQRVQLPRSRFKAYDELTRLLLEEQPKRREQSAYAPRSTSYLRQETRERALARLAWETHQTPGGDALGKTTAGNVLADFCATHLGKTADEAHEIAAALLAIGTETVGIVIEKSPVDIGFAHRAFQEFLAARHLSNLPLADQKQFLKDWFENPQWHDVFLCLCHLNTRAGEVDDFVSIVESLQLPTEMDSARTAFLAAIAFGDLHCSASTARRLADDTFETIETGVHERTRERLVELALDGLESDSLRSVVEARIQRWFPLRHPYRRGLYGAVATWSKSRTTQDTLWRGLLDEQDWNQRPAAESLAHVFGEDLSVAKRLFELLCKPAEPRALGCALHALCLGWATHPRLTGLLDDARFSSDGALQSVAVIHRVKRCEHDLRDREILVALARRTTPDSWHWRKDRARALITGWPGDLEIKHEAIRSVAQPQHHGQLFDWDDAGIMLLEGFPQDNDVAEAIAHLFRTEKYPGHRLGLHSRWGTLIDAFAGHHIMGEAVDVWLAQEIEQKGGLLFLDFQLCLISRSGRAKQYLLEADDITGIITEHQAAWLLQGWGMGDEDAAVALTRLAESSTAKYVAHLLPDILPDKGLCRQRLLDILREGTEFISRRALVGMIKLGVNELNEEVVEAAVNRYRSEVLSGAALLDLVPYFPNHPKLREIALHQLHNREGDLGTVARVYSSDAEIHGEVINLCSPLPAHLRSVIVDRLARLSPEDDFAHALLSNYDEDTDANVKTAAAIGYVASVKRRGENPSDLLDRLNEGLRSVGPDYEARRQAAFSALLELDRLDIVKAVWLGEGIVNFRFGSGVETNLCSAAHLARHWDRISQTFGESFWEHLGWVSDDFVAAMGSHRMDPDLFDKIVDRFGKDNGEGPSTAVLQLCARQWGSTPRLRELCLPLVRDFRIGNWMQTAPGIVAAEILAEQFASDTETFAMLESLVTQGAISSALVIALGTSWSESRAWEQLQKRLSEQDIVPRLLLPAQFHLLSAGSHPDEFVARVGSGMAKLRGDIWEFLPSCARAITARFARDQEVRDLALIRLETQATSSEKMNLPAFLLETDEHPERLRNWMRSEIKRQTEGTHLAEIALNLSTGMVQSVSHGLLEHLMG